MGIFEKFKRKRNLEIMRNNLLFIQQHYDEAVVLVQFLRERKENIGEDLTSADPTFTFYDLLIDGLRQGIRWNKEMLGRNNLTEKQIESCNAIIASNEKMLSELENPLYNQIDKAIETIKSCNEELPKEDYVDIESILINGSKEELESKARI